MRYDLRQPRKFDPRDVKVLIVDSNRFQRGLMSEIMRTVSIMEVATAKSDSDAKFDPPMQANLTIGR